MAVVSSDSKANKYIMTWAEAWKKCEDHFPPCGNVYGIPSSGNFVALMLNSLPEYKMVRDPADADFCVDDIVDSGATAARYKKAYGKDTFALVDKLHRPEDAKLGWIVFPWEQQGEQHTGPEENIRRVLQYLGEDTNREGLKDTPARVVRALSQTMSGYTGDADKLVTVFEEEACDEMVLLKDIEFYSTCEHHMLPFFGKAHIAYIPNGKIVGVSKLARILDHFACRLQIQERICQQVTELIQAKLQPLGCACVLEAQHMCMTSRGVRKQSSIMTTSSLLGAFKEDAATRAEFMGMIR